ncbi:LytTR family transcriptional regulator DNA-binding domain-containing protein [Acetobacterium tundrae]|uniref:LytTR family transcriptional regulator n=1 Tax=Acetobacterium tundrae TaxID=132932 RepID=A0ABR6WPB6_9FIRM|nr:LytTR family transcriptional regulator [Acetobacterium tundrae]
MKLKIHQVPNASETEIVINCQVVDERLEQLIKYITQYTYTLRAKKEGKFCFVPAEKIYYIDSVDSKTFLYSAETVYNSAESLIILENKLLDSTFVRISKNCILNIAYLESVHALWNHRLEASLFTGEKLIVTRHYIESLKAKIKG